MPDPFSISVRVYLEDTDAGGIVYYANYLKFMERARTEWVRDHGLSLSELADVGCQFVVHSMNVRYVQPARLDDELTVTTRIERAGRTFLEFQQQVLRAGELLCQGSIKVACIRDDTLKPMALPQPLNQLGVDA